MGWNSGLELKRRSAEGNLRGSLLRLDAFARSGVGGSLSPHGGGGAARSLNLGATMHRKFALLVLIALTNGSGCGSTAQQPNAGSTPQTQASNPVDSLKGILNPQAGPIAAYDWVRGQAGGMGRDVFTGRPETLRIDVRKTDSLVSPLVGECIMDVEHHEENTPAGQQNWQPTDSWPSVNRYQFNFAFQDKQWKLMDIKYHNVATIRDGKEVAERRGEFRLIESNWVPERAEKLKDALSQLLSGKSYSELGNPQ